MSTMRWADSDSESDEEFVPPPSPPSPEPEPEPSRPPPQPPLKQWQNQHHSPPRDHHGGGGGYPHHQTCGYGGRGGRGGGSGRGVAGGRHKNQQKPIDWREMAKASSRFSNANAPVDGSAWMAQRRAKMEQEEQQQREEHEKRLQQEHEEKRERRRSQLGALKAAMKEIKESEPPAPTSPGAPSRGSSTAAKDRHDGSPKQILRRQEPGQKQSGPSALADSEKPLSWRKQQKPPPPTSTVAGPPKYSYTVGRSPSTQPKPKAQLQPDGSVKFISQSIVSSVENSGNDRSGEKPKETKDTCNDDHHDPSNDEFQKSNKLNGNNKSHIIEFDGKNVPPPGTKRNSTADERSTTSRGSRQSHRGGIGVRGRGSGRYHSNRRYSSGPAGRGGGDDTSVSSRGSSSRMGGKGRGGRGRGRGDHTHRNSKESPPSNDINSEAVGRGRAGRGGRKVRGRGRGERDMGGKNNNSSGRSSSTNPRNTQKHGSTSPKPKFSYEIGAD